MKEDDLHLLQEAYTSIYESVDYNELIGEGFVKNLIKTIGALTAMTVAQANDVDWNKTRHSLTIWRFSDSMHLIHQACRSTLMGN